MSADLLREAAAKMRERAEDATPGPWRHEVQRYPTDHEVVAEDRTIICELEDGYVDNGLVGYELPAGPDAEHIASWHPAVALAVADWLDAEDTHQFGPTEHAINVARAYLGTEA